MRISAVECGHALHFLHSRFYLHATAAAAAVALQLNISRLLLDSSLSKINRPISRDCSE